MTKLAVTHQGVQFVVAVPVAPRGMQVGPRTAPRPEPRQAVEPLPRPVRVCPMCASQRNALPKYDPCVSGTGVEGDDWQFVGDDLAPQWNGVR